MERSYDDQWQQLANAIVEKAVLDYRYAIRGRGFDLKPFKKTIAECEKFFQSKWFVTLSGLNGRIILKKLKEEYENECNACSSNA